MPNQGSVSISKGFYKDSRGTIILPDADYSVSALTAGHTVGCKNNLFVYSNGVSSSALLTSLSSPTGATVYVDLEHPVYLDHTKQYIAGDTLKDPTMSYQTAASNYTVYGDVDIIDGIIQTSLTSNDYLENSNGTFTPGTSAWEFTTKITTQASLGTTDETFVNSSADQGGFRIGLTEEHAQDRWQFLVSNGSEWINTSDSYSKGHTVYPSTTYWIKAGCKKNTSNYTYYLKFSFDGVNYTDSITYSSGSTMKGYKIVLGNNFSGTLDLKETYLTISDSLWWRAWQYGELTVSDCLVYDDSTDTTYWKVKSTTTEVIAEAETLKHYNPIRLSNSSGIEAVPTIVSTGYDTGKAVYMNNPKTASLGIDNPYAFNMSQAESGEVVWKANDWTAIGPDVASGDYRVYSTNDVDRSFSAEDLWNLSLGSKKSCANLVVFNTSESETISNLNCLGTGYESYSYPYPSYDYTGYRVYFNSDYSAITNVEQYGQKCKIFKNGTGYVALKDSEGSNPTKAYTATSTAPIYNLVIDYPSSTDSFTYDSTANTVTIEGIVFNYVGSCLANV